MSSKTVYPTIGILARLKLYITLQLNLSIIDEMSVEQMVNTIDELPHFNHLELWEQFHTGTNLDSIREQWLLEMIDRHGVNNLEIEARRLYLILKDRLKQ